MVGYLTPDTIPVTKTCRTLQIPDDPDLVAVVIGSLLPLLNPLNWTAYGAKTPQETAQGLIQMYDDFALGKGACRMIGEIICYAGSTSPDIRWLPCDGRSLLRADYPDLFAVIGATYGAVDGSHFNLPDLRSRVPLMAGTGTGLSTYAIGVQSGQETHLLTTGEMPSHSHVDSGHAHGYVPAVPAAATIAPGAPFAYSVPGAAATGPGSAVLSNTGGGAAHNNIQPVLALNFLIVALP